MTKRKQWTIFLICLFIFILLTPIVVLYSFGWRIDFKHFDLLPSGALYLKANQTGIKVYLDGRFQKESSNLPIFNSIFIRSLAPRTYNVSIKKDGYLPWNKNLKIEPELVTETKNVILIPEKISQEILADKTLTNSNFIFSQDNKNIYWLSNQSLKQPQPNNPIFLNSLYLANSLFTNASPTSSQTLNIPSLKIKTEVNLIDISWDSKNFLLKTSDNRWFLYKSQTGDLINLNKILGQLFQKVAAIQFYPYKNSLLIFAANNLYEMNLNNLIVSFPQLKDILYYKISDNYIYFIDAQFTLSKADIYNLKIEKIISVRPIVKNQIPVFNLEINDGKLAFIVNSDLYLIDEKNPALNFIKSGIILTKFSDDNEKIAFTTKDNDLFVYYLTDISDQQPYKAAGDMDKILNFNETPLKIFWHQKEEYLYIQLENGLIFTEIDNRDRANYYPIITANVQNSYFNDLDNYLYLNLDSKIARIAIK